MEMDYTGIQEIDNAQRELNKKMEAIGERISPNITKQLDSHLLNSVLQIKREILGTFQVIAFSTFQEVFLKRYGKNFDIISLNNSLSFFIDDNLFPHIKYNTSNFQFNSAYFNDKRSFNQNVRNHSKFGDLMEYDEIDAIEEMEFEGLTVGENNPYDYALEEMDNIDEATIFKKRQYVLEPSEVYKEAEVETMRRYEQEYEYILKPIFKRKYGIIL